MLMRIIRQSRVFLLAVLMSVMASGFCTVSAQDLIPAKGTFPYKSGDTIQLVVPFSPGGGFDTYARLVAPYLVRAIQSIGGVDVNVIVRNMPGAGGRMAHEHVYRAKPDGKTLLILHGGAIQNYVAIFDVPINIEKFTYLAQFDQFVKGVMVRADLPVDSFSDLIKYSKDHQLRVATGGVGDDPHIDPLLMRELFAKKGVKWNIRFVHFEGTAPARAAVARGDADVLVTIITTMLEAIRDGDGKLISVLAEERYARFPKVPTLIEENIPAAREITDAMYASHVLAAPPGLSPKNKLVLEAAAYMAMNSTGYRNDAAKAHRDVDYLTGDQAKARVLAKLPIIEGYKKLLKSSLGL